MKQRLGYLATIGSITFALALVGCTNNEPSFGKGRTTLTGPSTYQASGTMRCSVDEPIFDDTCGYRVLHKEGDAAEIWVSDIAQPDLIRYRIIDFDGSNFTARSGEPTSSEKTNTARYKVNVGREHYLISHRSLTEGYKK